MNIYDFLVMTMSLAMLIYEAYISGTAPVRQYRVFWGKSNTSYAQNNTTAYRLDRHSSNISLYLMKISRQLRIKNR